MIEWEVITQSDAGVVSRIKVPGGWLYRLVVYGAGISSSFVPEPDKCRYHDEYLIKSCYSCNRKD